MSENDQIPGLYRTQSMQAVEAVRQHPLYQERMERLTRLEATRIYCRHGYDHLMSVARIAYIRALELGLPFRKQVVYAAALLHDIGKANQYESGEPHELAGERIAAQILADVEGFNESEEQAITLAVREHRRFSESSSDLGKLLFQADKASRACFACDVRDSCSWPREKMNLEVMI